MRAGLSCGFALASLWAVVLTGGCRSDLKGSLESLPLPYESRLKELVASGFEGPVMGFPETIKETIGPAGEWFFQGEPRYSYNPLAEVSPYYTEDMFSRQPKLGRLGAKKESYQSVLRQLKEHLEANNKRPGRSKKGKDERASWSLRELQSIQGGDIKDFEVLYEASSRLKEEWVPYALFYWRHNCDIEIKRRALYMRPRFKEGVGLAQQLSALGIQYANPIWVHPRLGMIYQVLDPSPKRPVFFLTTTPKLGPPRVEAIMNDIAPDIAELYGFVLYQGLELSAFHTLKSGKNKQLLHVYEPFLACHVLNKDIQSRLAELVKTAQGTDKTPATSAFAALKRLKDEETLPRLLREAERAAFEHGLLTESQKRLLLSYALKTIERFDSKIKDCQSKRLYATEAGLRWIKSAFVGAPIEQARPLDVESWVNHGKASPSVAEGTTLQKALGNMTKMLPVPKLSMEHGWTGSRDLLASTNAGEIGRLMARMQTDNFNARQAMGAPVWTFKIPSFNVRPEALKVRVETRTEKVRYLAPTPEYLAHKKKLRALKEKAKSVYRSIPVVETTTTRSEWGAVKYVSGGRTVGAGFAYRPVTTISTGINWLSGEAITYKALQDEICLMEWKLPAKSFEEKYLPLPVSYQIWSMGNERWDVTIAYKGRDIARFPVGASLKRELKRHGGSKAHLISAVDEWSSVAKMKAAFGQRSRKELALEIFLTGSLRALDFPEPYLKAVCPGASPKERALEAAWLHFWFLPHTAKLTELSELDRRLLPMGLIECIHKDRRALELTSISSRYPSRQQDGRADYPLNDVRFRRDFERPPLVIDRAGKLRRTKVHIHVGVANLGAALQLSRELASLGATLTRLCCHQRSEAGAVKLSVQSSSSHVAQSLSKYLDKQRSLKNAVGFERGQTTSCPSCGQDKPLRGPGGVKVEWESTIHISD